MSFVQESTTSEINGILGEQYTPLFVVPGFVCCSYAVEFPARPGGQGMFASLSKHATYIHSFCLIHISSSWLFLLMALLQSTFGKRKRIAQIKR